MIIIKQEGFIFNTENLTIILRLSCIIEKPLYRPRLLQRFKLLLSLFLVFDFRFFFFRLFQIFCNKLACFLEVIRVRLSLESVFVVVHNITLNIIWQRSAFIQSFARYCAFMDSLRLPRNVKDDVFFVPKPYISTARGRKNVKCKRLKDTTRCCVL